MKKLCTIIMLGLSVWVYGQKISEKDAVIKKEHKECMRKLFSFEDRKLGNYIPKKVQEQSQQFFLEDSLAASFLEIKEKNVNLKRVYNALRKGKQKEKIIRVATGEDPHFKIVGQDSVNNYVYYETNCEIHAIVKKDSMTSNAKFDVIFKWKEENKNKKKDKKENITIEEIRVNSKEYTTKELAKAKEEIKKWYAGLEKNLKEEYRNESVIPPLATGEKIELRGWDNQNKKFTIQGPQVKITVPWEIAAEDSIYYDSNPVAYYNLTPRFTISMIPDWTKKILKADIDTVVYEKGSIISPVRKVLNKVQTLSEGERKQKEIALKEFVDRFRIELMKYVGRQPESVRRHLENMFTDKKNAIVEVSYLIDYRERINSRMAEKYLARVNGELHVKLLKEQVQYDSTMDTVVFPFIQEYKGSGYSDYTTKELHLKYVDGSYFIERITVLPNSTRLKDTN